jgi:hypothetical protein
MLFKPNEKSKDFMSSSLVGIAWILSKWLSWLSLKCFDLRIPQVLPVLSSLHLLSRFCECVLAIFSSHPRPCSIFLQSAELQLQLWALSIAYVLFLFQIISMYFVRPFPLMQELRSVQYCKHFKWIVVEGILYPIKLIFISVLYIIVHPN